MSMKFAESMVKIGNIANSESFVSGEASKNCRVYQFINTFRMFLFDMTQTLTFFCKRMYMLY